MRKLRADYIITMNKQDEIIQNGEIWFDKKIEKIFKSDKNSDAEYLGKNSVLMAGFINTHTHLEFSANQTTLEYGNFMPWLNSVIENREELLAKCKTGYYKKAIDEMKKSGVVAFGEISSTGMDLKYCVNSGLKVLYFNEIIGSHPDAIEVLYQDFLGRLNESKKYENDKFKASISIHSPYSVHQEMIEKALKIAKKENMVVSAHFMESKAERKWLDSNDGEFKKFFKEKLNQKKALTTPMKFLNNFRDIKTHYIHCVHINDEELKEISSQNASIAHCPISNRLLNSGVLNLEKIKNIPFSVATDGLSSNYSLNILKELRTALMIHSSFNPEKLAYTLLKSVTKEASKILEFNNGSLEVGKDADIISFKLPNEVKNINLLPLQIILHIDEVTNSFINGKKIL